MLTKEIASNTQIRELLSRNEYHQAVFTSLVNALNHHNKLGDKGRDKDVINQFGEQAVRADLEAEQELIRGLQKYSQKTGASIEVVGEETGTTGIMGSDESKKFFAVIDGLDGSANYINPSEWPYGTMLAMGKGDNPKYKDFDIAGITLPEENWILLAVKGQGVFVYNNENDSFLRLNKFGSPTYDEARILSDNYFPEAKKMLGSMQEFWGRTGSTAATVTAIAIGDQMEDSNYPEMNHNWQGLADITRKGNLEQPSLYVILTELGGVLEDKNGNDIGENEFKVWGQTEKLPLISAKSHEIAERIREKLNLD